MRYLPGNSAPPSRNGFHCSNTARLEPSSSQTGLLFAVCILAHDSCTPFPSPSPFPFPFAQAHLLRYCSASSSVSGQTWRRMPKTGSFAKKVKKILPLTKPPRKRKHRALVCAAVATQAHQPEAIASIVADVGWGILDSSTIPPNPGPQNTQQPSVRFKSTIEEIAPNDAASASLPLADHVSLGNPGQVTSDEIRELSNRLRACPLQERRMNIFSYEPVSLPASRVRIFSVGFALEPSVSDDVLGHPVSLLCLG